MSEPYIGQITMFGGSFAPRGYALCNGQTIAINQNQALFALIGTTYGGNGVTTFMLPNLQSRLAVHTGTGAGLSSYVLGQNGGASTVGLNVNQIPGHTHSLVATPGPANGGTVGSGVVPATSTGPTTPPRFYAAAAQGQQPLIPHKLNPAVCGMSGGSQPHTNLMPSLCITFIIALQGIFPSRS